jgi:N4-gp56 family major capsid protein
MRTIITTTDPKTVKKWSASLFNDTLNKSYWNRKFTGESDNNVIQRLTDLESGAGDLITYDLSVQLRDVPTYGDNRLQGKEENLKFFSDEVKIDQMRKAVSVGGRMTRKRTVHDLRVVARDKLSDYWAKFTDEMTFIYLSGARGINEDYTELVTWAGHAGNAIQAPDADHIVFAGDATAADEISDDDIMDRGLIERALVKARMMRATNPQTANMIPVDIFGEGHYVVVMSPFQEHSLRNESTAGWLEIQKAAAAAEGRNNPIFKGGLGMINNAVLHSHESVIRFNDYGSGADVPAARALLLARQAGVIANGTDYRTVKGQGSRVNMRGYRFAWNEDEFDYGNEPTIAAGTICGLKKSRFNAKDFGVMAVDTYAVDPNAAA